MTCEMLTMTAGSIALPPGTRVLIVEDHPFVAFAAGDMIEMIGGTVSGIAATVEEALDAARRDDFDVALLDLDLEGRSSAPVASALAAQGKAFVVATGFDEARLADFPDAPLLGKPYRPLRLGAVLASVLDGGAGTSSSTSSVDSQRG